MCHLPSRPPLTSQLKEGVHPRRMAVVIPPSDADGGAAAAAAARSDDAPPLVGMLQKPDKMAKEGYTSLESKEPVLQAGASPPWTLL